MSGVLILCHGADPSALSVERELRRRSVPVTALDLGELPERGELSLEDDMVLLGRLALGPFSVVLNRSGLTTLGCPSPRGLAERSFKTWYGRYLAEKERQALLVSFLALLEARGARLINPPSASDLALLRPLLLDRLRRAGAAVAAPESRELAKPPMQRELVASPEARHPAETLTSPGARPPIETQASPEPPTGLDPGAGEILVRLYRFGRRTLAAGRLERPPGARPRYVALESLPEDAEKLASTVLEQTEAEFAAVDLVLCERSAAFWGWDPAPGFALFERDTGLEVAAPLAERLEEMLR